MLPAVALRAGSGLSALSASSRFRPCGPFCTKGGLAGLCLGVFPYLSAAGDGANALRRPPMNDTSGMLPNWLSEAVGDRHDSGEIALAVHRANEWLDLIGEAVQEAEQVMHAQRSMPGHGGGYPSYNHEVARAIVTGLARLYPDISLPRP